MQWYYSKNGSQLGPIGAAEIEAKLRSGEIAPTDLVWKDGMADWVPASQVGELRALVSGPAATPVTPAAAIPASTPIASSSPYGTPQAPIAPAGSPAVVPGMPLKSGLAIASMICGIVGLLTCCIWCLSLPLAIVGVVLGHVALSKAKSDPAQFGGKGQAKAGLVTGYLGILASLLFIGFSAWVQTANPEDLNFLPEEVRQKFMEARERQENLRVKPESLPVKPE